MIYFPDKLKKEIFDRLFAINGENSTELINLDNDYYLAGIEMPTLVTWEKDNKAISWEHSHVVMSLLPHGKLFLMDDAAYFSMARRPEEYASAVKEFLAL